MIGTRVAHYEIVSELGKGGMGEVYLARDTKLDRDVAIKVLPEAFLVDPVRLARFEREAKVLASLNHPHIAAIYGVEEAGDKRCLVLELAEGETLSERVARGAIPVREAIEIATQIATALEAAHDQGIVHRDLKPDNIKIDEHNQIKVLDFGLAKTELGDPTLSGSEPMLTHSPTMTQGMTTAGTLMGTAGYMSPEQARGKPVDQRADLWALGCVLYEMLAGRKLFGGETVTDILAAVITHEPDLAALPALPPALERLLKRCLTKDVRDRLRHAGDARLELGEALEQPAAQATAGGGPDIPRRVPVMTIGVTAVLAVLFGLATGWVVFHPSPAPLDEPTRLMIDIEYPLDRSGLPQRLVDISADGRRIAFSGNDGGLSRIYVRDMDSLEVVEIPGSDGGVSPFFSPDGRSIGFSGRSQWMTATIGSTGATSVVGYGGLATGADWGDDGTIVFCSNVYPSPMLVPAEGGELKPLEIDGLEPASGVFSWPQFLPGAREVLATYGGKLDGKPGPHVVLISRESRKMHVLTQGRDPRYVANGYLVFAREAAILAAAYTPGATELAGAPFVVPALDNSGNIFGMRIAVSENGTLVYAASDANFESELVWVTRDGSVTPAATDLAAYATPRISPDGKRAISWLRPGGLGRMLINDFERDLTTSINTEEFCAYPIWSPDGGEVFFMSTSGAAFSVYSVGVDSSDAPQTRIDGDFAGVPLSFSPDGENLLVYYVNPETKRDIWLATPNGDKQPLVITPHNERGAMFSPDGRWFAYVSDEDGDDEIYLRQFPDSGKRWQVSIDGGTEPMWAPDGNELYYRVADRMMAVALTTQGGFHAERPRELFSGSFVKDGFGNAGYDISPDGQRFLMVKDQVEVGAARLMIVLDWFQALEELDAGL